jgi:hypothetical protein
MANKGYADHMIQTITHIYEGPVISIDKGIHISSKTEIINQGVRQGCPLSPTLFSIYMDAATSQWQTQLRSHFRLGTMILDTLSFADDQVIFTKSEDELQMATLQFNNTMATYNLEISQDKTKNMAFCGNYQIRSKIILNDKTTEQVKCFNYLGCDISFNYDKRSAPKKYTNSNVRVVK